MALQLWILSPSTQHGHWWFLVLMNCQGYCYRTVSSCHITISHHRTVSSCHITMSHHCNVSSCHITMSYHQAASWCHITMTVADVGHALCYTPKHNSHHPISTVSHPQSYSSQRRSLGAWSTPSLEAITELRSVLQPVAMMTRVRLEARTSCPGRHRPAHPLPPVLCSSTAELLPAALTHPRSPAQLRRCCVIQRDCRICRFRRWALRDAIAMAATFEPLSSRGKRTGHDVCSRLFRSSPPHVSNIVEHMSSVRCLFVCLPYIRWRSHRHTRSGQPCQSHGIFMGRHSCQLTGHPETMTCAATTSIVQILAIWISILQIFVVWISTVQILSIWILIVQILSMWILIVQILAIWISIVQIFVVWISIVQILAIWISLVQILAI